MKLKYSSLKLISCAKLALRYYDPFEILERFGHAAYIVALLVKMRDHNVFHVSLLKKYMHDRNHVIDWNVIQVEAVGEFQVEPMCILDRRETMLRNRAISQVEV